MSTYLDFKFNIIMEITLDTEVLYHCIITLFTEITNSRHCIDNRNFNQDFKTLKWTDEKICRLNETNAPYRAATE